MDDLVTYMGYQWIQIDGNVITIGINEEGLEEFSDISKVDLPTEKTTVAPDEVCGEIETDQGPLNIYSPIDGAVVEVNEAVVQNPLTIQEDCYGDGWLFKIEAEDADQIDELVNGRTSVGDDDGDDEDDGEDEDEERESED